MQSQPKMRRAIGRSARRRMLDLVASGDVSTLAANLEVRCGSARPLEKDAE